MHVARVILVFLAGLLCACGERLGNPRDSADELFKLVSAEKFEDAYARASVTFKLTRSARYFEARARELGLVAVSAVEWESPALQGRIAKVRGVFTRKDGSTLTLNLSLIAEGGGWRLSEAMSDPAAKSGVVDDVFAVAARSRDTKNLRALEFTEPNALSVPAERELQKLAEETLLKFGDATLNGGDFTSLYEDASDRWKYRGRNPSELAYSGTDPDRSKDTDPFNDENRLTNAALRNAFAAAIAAKVDLSLVRDAKMILDEPARINSDGVLNFKGAFACAVFQRGQYDKPCKLQFALEYVMEATKWKLFGITINVIGVGKPPGE